MAGPARVRHRWAVLYHLLSQRGAGRDSVLNMSMSLYLDANPAFGHLGVNRNGEVDSLLSTEAGLLLPSRWVWGQSEMSSSL